METERLYEYLRQFHPITKAEFVAILDIATAVSYKRKDIITAAGQIQKNLLLVTAGVQRSFFLKDDKDHTLAFTYAVSVSGIPESFLTQSPSPYWLEALTDSQMLAINHEKLQTLFDRNRTIETLFRKVTEAVLIGTLHRQFEMLSTTNEERFIAFARRSPHLFTLVPHKYIASYLRIYPTNFSKLYNTIRF